MGLLKQLVVLRKIVHSLYHLLLELARIAPRLATSQGSRLRQAIWWPVLNYWVLIASLSPINSCVLVLVVCCVGVHTCCLGIIVLILAHVCLFWSHHLIILYLHLLYLLLVVILLLDQSLSHCFFDSAIHCFFNSTMYSFINSLLDNCFNIVLKLLRFLVLFPFFLHHLVSKRELVLAHQPLG
jgi:hypothetical protein